MKAKKLRRAIKVETRKEVNQQTADLLTRQMETIKRLERERNAWKFGLIGFSILVSALAVAFAVYTLVVV